MTSLPPFSFCHPPEQPRRKSQNLNFCDGYPEIRDPEKRRSERATMAESMRDYYPQDKDENGASSDVPKWLKYDRQVLRFYCYFKEPVNERREENFRLRKCTIYFYLEDGSLHISEPRQDNSGIIQGTFLKRHKVPKSGGGFISVCDFKLGSDITVYDRTYRICTCDTFTKRYLLKNKFNLGKEEDFPGEPLSTYRESMKRHCIKNRKNFANKQFLENDGKVLRFFAVWDDRHSVYGDRRPYVLHYFLADDTVEILEINDRNSGRYNFPMLLKRSRLPREVPSDLLGKNLGSDALPKSAFYNDTDLHIGSYIRVYNRDMLLHDCDSFTRNYYRTKYGIADDMLDTVDIQEAAPVLSRMEMPPHNGFGTEVDSMQNCISLIPKPPHKDFNKIIGLDGKVICFSAKFGEDERRKVAAPDQGRTFVVQFFLADDSVAVYEPPCRNSGIQGGKFLSRQAAPNKPNTSKQYAPDDFYVGAKVYLHDRIFELIEADEWTLKWMEQNPHEYPMSDYNRIIHKVEKMLAEVPDGGCKQLKSNLLENSNETNVRLTPEEQIAPLLLKAGIKLAKQEIVTLQRHISRGLDSNTPDIQTLFINLLDRVSR